MTSAEIAVPPERLRLPSWLRPRSLLRRVLGSWIGAISALILLLVVAFAVAPSLIAPYDPYQSATERFAPPSTQHLLGTDNLARDIFSRIIYGARTSLAVGAAALVLGTIGGSLLGLVSGYFGGAFDMIVQRLMDGLLAIPALLLAMALVSVLGPGLKNAIIAITVTLLPGATRVIRSTALSEKEQQYIEAARTIGAGDSRIIFRHILPNTVAPVLVLASAYLGAAILLEATLGFLGLGAQPPTISWGTMLSNTGLRFLQSHPRLAVFPGLAISVTVFALSMLGDLLRDALDPRLRNR